MSAALAMVWIGFGSLVALWVVALVQVWRDAVFLFVAWYSGLDPTPRRREVVVRVLRAGLLLAAVAGSIAGFAMAAW